MKVKLSDIKNYGNSVVVTWKYSYLDSDLPEPHNNFDAIVTYNVKEEWVLLHLLRYGIQGNKDLPEITKVSSTRYITDLNKLEDYFMLNDPLENKMYSLLKEDLSKEEFEFNDFDQTAKCIAQKECI